jgi:hypothetical protein
MTDIQTFRQTIEQIKKEAIPIYRDLCIYPNQIEAFKNIIQKAIYNPYVCLVAQMQSGKTGTFLLSAFEFLRMNMVDRVVIFSGNSDLELKKQTLKGIDDFVLPYINYLQYSVGLSQMESQMFYTQFKAKINVLWSNDLAKNTKAEMFSNTLFIWEESHYAQSIEMLPFDFLKLIQLSPSGIPEKYIEKRNYFISVSATPFSEIANIVLQNQEKKIVYLVPDVLYKGVKYFMDNDYIIEHENDSDDLRRAIQSSEQRNPQNPMYGIVRCYGPLETQFIEVARQCRWDVQHHNLNVKDTINGDISLPTKPQRNTLVFIKGALRMGKQVCKKHIGFVFETSENPNTDTILQGLLGRMCSFEPVDHMRIYLYSLVVHSGELERYTGFIQSISDESLPETLPQRAMNVRRGDSLVHKTKLNTYSTCPIFVPGRLLATNAPMNACISAIFNDIGHYTGIIDKNNATQKTEIRDILIDNESQFSVHKLSKASNISKLGKLMHSLQSGSEFHSGSSNYEAVHIWMIDVIQKEYPELQLNDIFIEVKTKSYDNKQNNKMNVITNQNEVFYRDSVVDSVV